MLLVKQRSGLVVTYGALGLVFALVARSGSLAPEASAAFLATLWLGFVLAISFMEAWIKFQAPFLPRHIGLSVGRTVFQGLNAVEAPLAVGLVLVHAIATFEKSQGMAVGLLIALIVLLVLQVVWVFPKLNIRGDYIIDEQLRRLPDNSFTPEQRVLRDEIHMTVQSNANPSIAYHIMYIHGEVAKVVLLMVYIVHFLRAMSK
jgi:hypothetical protein